MTTMTTAEAGTRRPSGTVRLTTTRIRLFGRLVLSSANAGARSAAEPSESLQVVLLPNPVTHGQVQVLVPSAAGEVYVQVVDLQGRTVLLKRQAANRINLSVAHLAKGVYLALVHTEGKLVMKKFVVE